MQIQVNGDPTTVPNEACLADLVAQFELKPQRIAIEVNERLVKRTDYAATALHEGDRVEIVTLVGGG